MGNNKNKRRMGNPADDLKNSAAGTDYNMLGALCCYAVILVFFAIYTFNNPDLSDADAHCVVLNDNPTICTWNSAPFGKINIGDGNGEVAVSTVGTDMTSKFINLFM